MRKWRAPITQHDKLFYAQKKNHFPVDDFDMLRDYFCWLSSLSLLYLSRLVVIVRGDDYDDDEEEKNDCDWKNEGKDGRIRFFNKSIGW